MSESVFGGCQVYTAGRMHAGRQCTYYELCEEPTLHDDGRYLCTLQEAEHLAPDVLSAPYLGQCPSQPG